MEPSTSTLLMAHPSPDLYGSDRVFLESVSAFVDRGWDVVATVPATGPLIPLLEERGARTVVCPTPVLRKSILRPAGMVDFARDLVRGLRRGSRLVSELHPAVVYVNTLTIPLWILLARVRAVPVVSHVHEAERSASWAARRILCWPLLFSTRIIANSRFSADVLTESFPRLARRTTVVLNGVLGPPDPRIARSEITVPVELLYVGRLSPRKGVEVAVAAASRLCRLGLDVRLRLVGAVFPGYEWFEDRLRFQVEESGLRDRVVFAGFQKRVWDFVDECDVMLVPSLLDEPFGNTAVEAILGGRPVVASATSGLLEATAGYASATTVPAGDPAALAAEVQRIVESWPAVRNSAWADRETALARHSPQRYRATIADEVERLVESSSRSARVR